MKADHPVAGDLGLEGLLLVDIAIPNPVKSVFLG
jgi:hypothetical protein